MKFLRDNWSFLIIVFLVVLLFLQRYGSSKPVVVKQDVHDTVVVKDTITVKGEAKHDTLYLTKKIPAKPDTQYVASTNCDTLKKQYNTLVQDFTATYVYKRREKLDSFGIVDITDSISENKFIGTGLTYSLKIPKETTTITNIIYPKPKNQWFIGGSIEGNKTSFVRQLNVDLLLINKQNKGYTIGTGVDLNGIINYRVGMKWKL